MIDIALLRTEPDLVRHVCRAKGSDVDVDKLIDLDSELRRSQVHAEKLRADQKRRGKGADIEAARALKAELQQAADKVRALQRENGAFPWTTREGASTSHVTSG